MNSTCVAWNNRLKSAGTHNLSDITLSKHHNDLLSYSHKSTITPRGSTLSELNESVTRMVNGMKWKVIFGFSNNKILYRIPKYYIRSNSTPSCDPIKNPVQYRLLQCIDNRRNILDQSIEKLYTTASQLNIRRNLNLFDFRFLHSLKSNPIIKLTLADKGLVIPPHTEN